LFVQSKTGKIFNFYSTSKGEMKMDNKCDFCRQEFNKDYEYKCPTCGTKVVDTMLEIGKLME
jgi:DNA-directed RNA polymerase subunit RPC12/RpoP